MDETATEGTGVWGTVTLDVIERRKWSTVGGRLGAAHDSVLGGGTGSVRWREHGGPTDLQCRLGHDAAVR